MAVLYAPWVVSKLWNQCSFVEASIVTDCAGLKVQTCGFRLLFQNDEVEFDEARDHYRFSFDKNALAEYKRKLRQTLWAGETNPNTCSRREDEAGASATSSSENESDSNATSSHANEDLPPKTRRIR